MADRTRATDRATQLAAAQARVAALEAARAEDERREKVQAALYRIASTASTVQDLQEFYAAIHEIVGSLMYGENFFIAIYDDARGMINFPYYRDSVDLDIPDPDLWEPFGIGNASGLTAYVLRTGETQLVTQDRWRALLASGEVASVGEDGEDWLGVPLRAEDRAIGVVVVQTYRPAEHYTDDDARILTFVGQHIATALSRVRAMAEVRQRNAELAIVNEVAQALGRQLDFPSIIEAVGERAAEALSADGLTIAMLDPETESAAFLYWTNQGVRNREFEGTVLDDVLTVRILASGQPVRVGSADEAEAIGAPFKVGGTESYLGVPIPAGDRTIGVIAIGTAERHAYSRDDERLLSTLATNMGVALENARLFGETNRLLVETNERAAELAIINSVQQGLAAQLETQAMYDLVGGKIQEIFDAQVVDIGVLDKATGLIHFPYTIERGVRFPDEPMSVIGFRKQVFETKVPVVVNRDAKRLAVEAGQPGAIQGEPAKSAMFAPLMSAGEVIGVISLQNLDREDAFGDAEIRLLTTLAATLSVALENVRLVEETRQRASELETINSISQALAFELDLDALIDLVGERMREVFEADIVYVALRDAATDMIEFPYYVEGGRREPQAPLRYGEGLTSRILQDGEPMLLNRDEQFQEIGTHGVGTVAKSWLGVPIVVDDEAIGVICVQSSTEEGRFGESDARLLATLAASVGIAIRTARAFQAQREAEQRYRLLVEELPLAVYIDRPGDPMAACLYVSPPIEAMFGYPPEKWLEDGFFGSIVYPDDRAQIESVGTYLHTSGDRASDEYRIVAADGRVVWVRDDNRLVRDEDGMPSYVLGFFVDVTRQAEVTAEVRRQKQYFERLVEISPVAVVTMDRHEIVSGWNPAATTLFGYRPEEAIGGHIDELLFAPDERAEGAAATRLADESGRAQLIGRRRRKDGELVDVEMVLVPLVVDGEHVGYYAIYHDITELQAARREADAANEAKSTFLASMSHEIRTPMNAVIGMSGLILQTSLDAEQRDFAETIQTSADALLTIINDILDFSKIEAGRIELEALPFALGPCIEGAIDVVAPTAAAKRVELAYAIDPVVPYAVVGDPGRLRQIVLNLLSNAVKFTESGEVVVSVSGRRHEAPGPDLGGAARWEVAVAVRDTGIGIPPERMDRLFQSFSQADASISRRYGGTGLGLAISRRLAELQGGSIIAESTGVPGEGSRFIVRIIAAEAAPDAVVVPAPRPSADLTGKAALVVDDNPTNRRILIAQLRQWGMSVRATGSAREAIDWVRDSSRFDVALVDFLMPELDGIALATALGEITDPAPLPVIVASSVSERGREPEPRNVVAWLTKPIKPSPLLDALHAVLSDVAPEPTAEASTEAPARLGDRHPLRILLAEDNAVNQKLALRLLQQIGYEADIAGNGLEAIAALEAATYDLVLMDVQMPDCDGLEATRRIRTRWPGTAGPRIVAMTANAMAGDREACLAAGMDDYISKPIRVEELTAALEATSSRSAVGEQPRA